MRGIFYLKCLLIVLLFSTSLWAGVECHQTVNTLTETQDSIDPILKAMLYQSPTIIEAIDETKKMPYYAGGSVDFAVTAKFVGYVLDTLNWGVGLSGFQNNYFLSMRQIDDDQLSQRVNQALDKITKFNTYSKYPDVKVVIIDGDGLANAMTSGTSIYLTKRLLELVDDDQLIAVLIHELSHSKEGHILLKLLHKPAAAGAQLNLYARRSVGQLSQREIGYFSDEVDNKGHLGMIDEMVELAGLGEEIQADEEAFFTLCKMKKQGLDVDPGAVASAIQITSEVPAYALKIDQSDIGKRWRLLLAQECPR